jgi:anti-anti-sigma regulatory factor
MMRRHAVVDSAAGLAPFGHLAWGYGSRAELLSRAAEYISDGLRQNQYIAYARDRSHEVLRSELASMPGIGEHLDSGRIEVWPTDDYYVYCPGTDVIDADGALAKYLDAVNQAIAKGYSGFRAVSDVTPVARTPEQRDALARLEYLVDQQMAVLPFSALCAYDIDQLGAAADELMCLHPFVSEGSVMFRIFADPDAETDFALAGEIDASSDELFETALQRVWPLLRSNTVRIGARKLEFIGHQQLCTLEERAREHDRKVVLSTDQPTVARLIEVLGLSHVRANAPAR